MAMADELIDDPVFLDPVAGDVVDVGAVCLQARTTVGKGDARRRYRYFVFDPALPENSRPHLVFCRIAETAFELGMDAYAMRDVDVPDEDVPDFFSDGAGHAVFVRNYANASYGDIGWLSKMLGMDERDIRELSRGTLTRHHAEDGKGEKASGEGGEPPEARGGKPDGGQAVPSRLRTAASGLCKAVMGALGGLAPSAARKRAGRAEKRPTPLLEPLGTSGLREGRGESEPVPIDRQRRGPSEVAIGATHAPEPAVLNYESEVYVTSPEHEMGHLDLRAYSCLADGAGNTRLVKVKTLAERKDELARLNRTLKKAGCAVRRAKREIECAEVELARGQETDGVHWLADALGEWSSRTGLPAAFVTHFRQIDPNTRTVSPHVHLMWYKPDASAESLRDEIAARIAGAGGAR